MGSELIIRFTYRASGGGQLRNPYVAVWVENVAGELVDTVAVWFEQSSKGRRWLSDLRRWSSVGGATQALDTVSSATRTPGTFDVVWDGVDMDNAMAATGDCFICIEAAREHGPYSLIRERVALGTQNLDKQLTANGELASASIEYVVA